MVLFYGLYGHPTAKGKQSIQQVISLSNDTLEHLFYLILGHLNLRFKGSEVIFDIDPSNLSLQVGEQFA